MFCYAAQWDDICSRYVQNNFKDVERQAAIDMCLGKDAQQGTSSLCEMAWQQQQLEVCQAFPSVRQLGHCMLWPSCTPAKTCTSLVPVATCRPQLMLCCDGAQHR